MWISLDACTDTVEIETLVQIKLIQPESSSFQMRQKINCSTDRAVCCIKINRINNYRLSSLFKMRKVVTNNVKFRESTQEPQNSLFTTNALNCPGFESCTFLPRLQPKLTNIIRDPKLRYHAPFHPTDPWMSKCSTLTFACCGICPFQLRRKNSLLD